MATKRITTRALAGMTLVSGLFGGAAAAQSPDALLARKPVQPGVQVTTPTGAELAGCKAEAMSWPKNGTAVPTGQVVKDAQGKLVRQFVDTTGRNNPNIFSFYLNGVESYREMDVNGDGKPDRYRWLGANGSKFGDDKNGDGVVDTWYVLSPEELTQELFQALVTKDSRRLAALVPTPEELKAAGMPEAEIAKITQRTAGISKKVSETFQALNLSQNAKWVHVELGIPQTTPGDAVGSQADIVTHKSVTVLFDKGDGKSAEVFQAGELVLVGRAWKLVDGPAPGMASGGPEGGDVLPNDPDVQRLVAKLQDIKAPANPSDRAAVTKFHTDKAAIFEQIVAKTQGVQQEPWLKQMVEAYQTAAEAGDANALTRLKQWFDVVAKTAPGSASAGFVAFRVMNAEYAAKLTTAKPEEVGKVQTWWRETLEGFVKTYPTAEDTPEAMFRLAMALEFTGNEGEGQAKTWYENLAKTFPSHQLAARAQGAVKRLTSEGQPLQLSGPKIGGGEFNPALMSGKPAVVFYWATWMNNAEAELKGIAELGKTYAGKLEIVTVNLDVNPGQAVEALKLVPIPGHHLFAPGGLDASPLAVAYGIQMAPHVFTVGKDGKVFHKNVQTGPMLKDEVDRLVK